MNYETERKKETFISVQPVSPRRFRPSAGPAPSAASLGAGPPSAGGGHSPRPKHFRGPTSRKLGRWVLTAEATDNVSSGGQGAPRS